MAGERVGFSGWVRGMKVLGTAEEERTPNDRQYVSFGPEINFYNTSNAGITASVTKYMSARNLLDASYRDTGLFLNM